MRPSRSIAVLSKFIATLLIFMASSAIAEESPQASASGDLAALFRDAKYPEALALLQANPRPDSAAFHYNLGTLHLKLGFPGLSLAHLEKANRLKRHDPEIQHNLQIARSEVSKIIGSEKLDPSSTGLEKLADRISIVEVRGTLGLLALLISAVWLRSYLKSRALRRMLLNPASVLLLLALTITGLLYAAQRYTELHPPAILIEARSARSGPGNGYIELARLESGVKVRIMNAAGAPEEGSAQTPPAVWLQVRFSPQEIGWIRASSMLLL